MVVFLQWSFFVPDFMDWVRSLQAILISLLSNSLFCLVFSHLEKISEFFFSLNKCSGSYWSAVYVILKCYLAVTLTASLKTTIIFFVLLLVDRYFINELEALVPRSTQWTVYNFITYIAASSMFQKVSTWVLFCSAQEMQYALRPYSGN